MKPAVVIPIDEILKTLKNRVLLINPPVFDSRYPWIKWNQPLDLMRLATYLNSENQCEVKLFDFMQPTADGKVPKLALPENDSLLGDAKKWHFGKPWREFELFLDDLKMNRWIPEAVWITSLTSFWWQSIPLVADRIKNRLKGSKIIVAGNYPTLEEEHARVFCFNADFIAKGSVRMLKLDPSFAIYGNQKPSFLALDLQNKNLITEVVNATDSGIHHFAFFNDNIFDDFNLNLKPFLEEVITRKLKVYFHGICGVEINNFPLNNADLLVKAHFCELHLEPGYTNEGIIDEKLYREVMKACEKTGLVTKRGDGWESRDQFVSGFLWIGKMDDDINKLVHNSLKLLQLTGMVIPKPFSPSPRSLEYQILKEKSGFLSPEDISPHRLPLAGINGVSKDEYENIYRFTAFLNMRVRGHTFDFLANNYLAKVFRESLTTQRWIR